MVTECIPLMRQLARMAGIPEGRISRMVLVLSVDDIPRLFTEGFLMEQEELETTTLAHEERAVIVDTSSMQGRELKTLTPIEPQ